MNICSICGTSYKGMGNNAQPINDGRCCDKCNFLKVIPARMENTDKYARQYPKSQTFLKETEEALGEKAAFVDIKERPLKDFCDLCGGHDGEHGGTCKGFKTVEERDQYLVEEAKNDLTNDLSRLVARIGLPATKSFILDWVDTIKF